MPKKRNKWGFVSIFRRSCFDCTTVCLFATGYSFSFHLFHLFFVSLSVLHFCTSDKTFEKIEKLFTFFFVLNIFSFALLQLFAVVVERFSSNFVVVVAQILLTKSYNFLFIFRSLQSKYIRKK